MGVVSRVLAMFLVFLSARLFLFAAWLICVAPRPAPTYLVAGAGLSALLVVVATREVAGCVQNVSVDA